MMGRGIGPAMSTSAAHYQSNEEAAYAASGEAKVANGAEQLLFLINVVGSFRGARQLARGDRFKVCEKHRTFID